MIDDYETIDFRKHYEATKEHDQRIAQLEKQVKSLMAKDFESEL